LVSETIFLVEKCFKKGKRYKRVEEKKKGWIEILPRFKIQFPMKNWGKDALPGIPIQE
jgi:hypothetical protein